MALWLMRAGRRGEHEQKFLQSSRVYATWNGFAVDFTKLKDKLALRDALLKSFSDASEKAAINWSGQLWAFAHEMKPGDWVVLPLKGKPAIVIGEITGNYEFDSKAEDPYFHSRKVKWLTTDVPRSAFKQDLLYSFGAFMTICQITRNEAEGRVRAMAKAGWKPEGDGGGSAGPGPGPEPAEAIDLERLARDRIAELVIGKFKGHGLAILVEAILKAQGYTTFRSPEGPDKGVDILAAPGTLGFGSPRIAVQVKSGEGPVDRPTLDMLIGAMSNFKADQGLLVSWGGFKSSIDRETAQQFFRVRLWDADDLIEQIMEHYDKLDEDLRAELPLKRFWTVAAQEDET